MRILTLLNHMMVAADAEKPRHSDEYWRKFQLAFRNYAMPKFFVSESLSGWRFFTNLLYLETAVASIGKH
ncbi:hypothetical protein CEN48_14915 [Fischerella thermalis CCMEE 5282]|uniref:hypothetical protein n=1 Tax=Fischerella thermalis TaxID=372787 RepID=UPI000C7FA39E|nr:hypothetical protein [Fischerella thermalis]PMB13201.1 hypothetical protein CEN48_14915 [Fischerella thermalis CCMEE 5282]